MAALRAPQASETPAEDTTVQIPSELAFDEAGIALSVTMGCLIEEGLEMLAHHPVQDALLWFATAIGERQGSACRTGVALVVDRGQRGFARMWGASISLGLTR